MLPAWLPTLEQSIRSRAIIFYWNFWWCKSKMHFCWHCGMCQCVALFYYFCFFSFYKSFQCRSLLHNCSVALRPLHFGYFYFLEIDRSLSEWMDLFSFLMRNFSRALYFMCYLKSIVWNINVSKFLLCNYNQLANISAYYQPNLFSAKLFLNNVIKFVEEIITIIRI